MSHAQLFLKIVKIFFIARYVHEFSDIFAKYLMISINSFVSIDYFEAG